jgi:hypothetical protein
MMPIELDGSVLKSSVAFTGRMACISRTEAFDVVRQHGGTRYENALADLLKRKEAGEKIEPAKEGPSPQVVNLKTQFTDTVLSQPGCGPAALHRRHSLVEQMLHEHAAALSAASRANRSRRLINVRKNLHATAASPPQLCETFPTSSEPPTIHRSPQIVLATVVLFDKVRPQVDIAMAARLGERARSLTYAVGDLRSKAELSFLQARPANLTSGGS